jgi:nitrate/nitrite transporter NarK
MLTELAPSQREIESWEWTNEVRTDKTLFLYYSNLFCGFVVWFLSRAIALKISKNSLGGGW